MSGAILGWGLDLGQYDSVAAKLFDNVVGLDNTEGWEFYVYGAKHERLALLLMRSVVCKEPTDEDFSVDIKVNLGATGYPVLSSQPTPGEIQDLVEIIEEVRPDKDTVELNLDLLLLPAD
jgi:hypothetical protein